MNDERILTEEQVRLELSKKIKMPESLYMMGTEAHHLLGNISSDEPDIFSAHEENDDYFIGNWITGFGFFNVLFPKKTSRRLNIDEVEKYTNMNFQLASYPSQKLKDVK